jgi:predicted neutral ceramidase superfamily lipid hydrolase
MDPKIKLIMILLGVFLIYPLAIMLVSRLFTPIDYLPALLYSFIVRVVKYNYINRLNK